MIDAPFSLTDLGNGRTETKGEPEARPVGEPSVGSNRLAGAERGGTGVAEEGSGGSGPAAAVGACVMDAIPRVVRVVNNE